MESWQNCDRRPDPTAELGSGSRSVRLEWGSNIGETAMQIGLYSPNATLQLGCNPAVKLHSGDEN
jgi:hypothetical protein